jgi:NADPH-dependent glutamate synthase beta subunit-like oxidoreductase
MGSQRETVIVTVGNASTAFAPRIPMRRLPTDQAIAGFDEVLVGYSPDEAVMEATRIVKNGLLTDVSPCLFGIDIPRFVTQISRGSFTDALMTIFEAHRFPGVLGRHCTRPCEQAPSAPSPQHAPNFSGLERAAAEFGDWSRIPFRPGEPVDHRVAIIGAGSTGGALAHRLRTLGHSVDLYDQLPFAGGMMRVGYPAFRLPERVLEREWSPERWGVTVHYGVRADAELVHRLLADFDAVAVTAGKFRARRSGVPGEDLAGVQHALDFLVNFRTGGQVDLGEDALVIGGGYTARDASRTCLRLGSRARIVYRGDVSEMPVAPYLRQQFVQDQAAEGAPYTFNTAITEFLAGPDGRVRAAATVEVVRENGELIPVPGTESEILTDTVLLAIGEETDLTFLPPEVAVGDDGRIMVDATGATSLPGLYAAGEIAGVGRTAESMLSGVRLADHLGTVARPTRDDRSGGVSANVGPSAV